MGVCRLGYASGQAPQVLKGLSFEKTLPRSITKSQEQGWLLYLLEELHARYWKEWNTEEISDYIVGMTLEIASHGERAFRTASATFYNAGKQVPEESERMKTLFLLMDVLIPYDDDKRSIEVVGGKLKFVEPYSLFWTGNGAMNPLALNHRSNLDEMKEMLGVRDLAPFVNQRLSDSVRLTKWKAFVSIRPTKG